MTVSNFPMRYKRERHHLAGRDIERRLGFEKVLENLKLLGMFGKFREK